MVISAIELWYQQDILTQKAVALDIFLIFGSFSLNSRDGFASAVLLVMSTCLDVAAM